MTESRLVPFEPPVPGTTEGNGNGNGAHHRGRRRVLGGISFGFLLGALLATSLVSQLQWLNLSRIGSWIAPCACAAAGGTLVGLYRRDRVRTAALGGAIAGVLSLWVVYGAVRLSVHVLFVERSFARVVASDLVRLMAYGGIGGGIGAVLGARTRSIGRLSQRRTSD